MLAREEALLDEADLQVRSLHTDDNPRNFCRNLRRSLAAICGMTSLYERVLSFSVPKTSS